jgi:hypothetical protein
MSGEKMLRKERHVMEAQLTNQGYNNMTKNFEDYLKEIHAEGYTGTKDNMPDSFEYWLSQLEHSELIDYATECVERIRRETVEEVNIICKSYYEMHQLTPTEFAKKLRDLERL